MSFHTETVRVDTSLTIISGLNKKKPFFQHFLLFRKNLKTNLAFTMLINDTNFHYKMFNEKQGISSRTVLLSDIAQCNSPFA